MNHLIGFVYGSRHGLFAQHLFAGAQSLHGVRAVQNIRRADADGLYALILEEVFKRLKHIAAVLLRERFGTLFVLIIKADDFGMGICRIFRRMTRAGDFTAADNGYAYFLFSLHNFCVLSLRVSCFSAPV